jgi:hypothetical protein
VGQCDEIFPEKGEEICVRTESAFQTARVFFWNFLNRDCCSSVFPIPCPRAPLCRLCRFHSVFD